MGRRCPPPAACLAMLVGQPASAEAQCYLRTGLLAPLCRDFLIARGWCLLMPHLASSLSLHHLAFWEGLLMLALGEAEGVSGTSLRAEKGS